MDRLRIAFSTLGSPDWTWRDVLDYGTRFGYDGVEVRLLRRETDLLAVPEFQPSELAVRRRELADAGFRVCGLASSVRFDETDEAARRTQLDTGRRYLDLAGELGASFVRVFGDVLPAEGGEAERRAAVARIAEGLQQLGEAAEGTGIDVLLETHGDFCDSRAARDVLSQVESPAVGVLWDTHHPWRFLGEPVAETFERLRPWLRHTHWKDSMSSPRRPRGEDSAAAAAEAHALMSGHRHADYVLFPAGEFPTDECLRLLSQGGYDGWYCIEWEKMWHPEIEDPEIALALFPRKLRWLHAMVVGETSQQARLGG